MCFSIGVLETLKKKLEGGLLGVYDRGDSSGLSDLGILVIIGNFHSSGKYDNLNTKLKM